LAKEADLRIVKTGTTQGHFLKQNYLKHTHPFKE